MQKELAQGIKEPDTTRSIQLDQGDENIFWFRDELHSPYPVTAFGMSTIQKGHMWGYALSAEEVKLPPSRGAAVKTYNNYVYLGFVGITDPEEIGKRGLSFGPFIENSIDNWETYYGNAMKEAECITVPLARADLGKKSYAQLCNHLKECQRVNLRCWTLHFLTMYVADVVYMGGEEFVKKHGMDEKDYSRMLKGFDTYGLASDRGQYLLAKNAVESDEILSLFESGASIDEILEKAGQSKKGKRWLKELNAYLNKFGHRSTAAVLDTNFLTWYEDPTPVLRNVQSLLPKIKEGYDFDAQREDTIRLRETAVAEFRATLSGEDLETFDDGIRKWQKAYTFNEDHWFFFEQMNWNSLHYAGMEIGKRLVELNIIEEQMDVFHLTYWELIEILEDLTESSDVGAYVYRLLYKPLVNSRKKAYEAAKAVPGPSFLGQIPERMEDPIAIKVFGITDFILDKARREGAGETVELNDSFKGFPGAPGEVEGPAVVALSHEDLPSIKPGSIVVCPYTSPAWTPIFPKLKAVVTDSGGMLTHAAITAREYGIPAVVGTWVATQTIKDGDIIRVNGTEGAVEILSRA